MQLCPIVMIRNEEYWIARVLAPLVEAFDLVLVGDTGSNDTTVEQARQAGAEVIEYGRKTMLQLPQVRKKLAEVADGHGYHWVLQVDGDELYHPDALEVIKTTEMPEGKRAGFVTGATIDRHDGEWWRLNDFFNRLAIYQGAEAQVGTYPFESPLCYKYPTTFHYFDNVDGLTSHHLHLHRLERSREDQAVYRRQEKQKQYSMIDRPEVDWHSKLEPTWEALLDD